MHISIQFCLDFFITSRSIHVVLIGFQYIFVSLRILVYFVSLRFVLHFSIFRFVAFRFAFQYISFRFVSFVAFRFRFVVQYNPLQHRVKQSSVYFVNVVCLYFLDSISLQYQRKECVYVVCPSAAHIMHPSVTIEQKLTKLC